MFGSEAEYECGRAGQQPLCAAHSVDHVAVVGGCFNLNAVNVSTPVIVKTCLMNYALRCVKTFMLFSFILTLHRINVI